MWKYFILKTDKDDDKIYFILKFVIAFGILALIYMGISSNINMERMKPVMDLCIDIFICVVIVFFYTNLISGIICDCSFDKYYKKFLKQSGYFNSYFVPIEKCKEFAQKSRSYANKISKLMYVISLGLIVGMMFISRYIVNLRVISMEILYVYIIYTLIVSIVCKLKHA